MSEGQESNIAPSDGNGANGFIIQQPVVYSQASNQYAGYSASSINQAMPFVYPTALPQQQTYPGVYLQYPVAPYGQNVNAMYGYQDPQAMYAMASQQYATSLGFPPSRNDTFQSVSYGNAAYGYGGAGNNGMRNNAQARSAWPQRQKVPQIPQRCVPCEKNFPNESQYKAHLEQHVTCPQCSFAAAKKVVTKHIQTDHAVYVKNDAGIAASSTDKQYDADHETVQSLRIMESPEEIAKWIEERKKRWPTEDNIKRRSETGQGSAAVGETADLLDYFKKDKKSKSSNRKRKQTDGADGEMGDDSIQNKKAKTRICKYFLKGQCSKGDDCTFRHEQTAKRKGKVAATEKSLQEKFQDLTEKSVLRDHNLYQTVSLLTL